MSYTVNTFNASPGYKYNDKGQRTYNIKYIVESTAATDLDLESARQATGMPQRGDPYAYDQGSFLRNINLSDMKFTDAGTIFFFDCEYTSSLDGKYVPLATDDPTQQPPKISFGIAKYQVPFDFAYKLGDTQGNPTQEVVTAAGQKFDPPAVKLKANLVINLDYNVWSYKGEWTRMYVETINRNAVSIIGIPVPAYCAKINDLSASNNYTNEGQEYFSVRLSIETSTEIFITKLANQALMAKSLVDTVHGLDHIYLFTNIGGTPPTTICCKSDFTDFNIYAKNGWAEPIAAPYNLDKDGYVAAVGDATLYLPFQQCYDCPWDVLNIPKVATPKITIRK